MGLKPGAEIKFERGGDAARIVEWSALRPWSARPLLRERDVGGVCSPTERAVVSVARDSWAASGLTGRTDSSLFLRGILDASRRPVVIGSQQGWTFRQYCEHEGPASCRAADIGPVILGGPRP